MVEFAQVGLSLFVRQCGRKAQKGTEPNDRRFDQETAERIKRHLKPAALDALLRDDEAD
jgi:hypothetical protein